jgi:hypothetical protein
VYLPVSLTQPIACCDLKVLLRLMYLHSPVRPPRLLQKVFQNLCSNPELRTILSSAIVRLLHEDGAGALSTIEAFRISYGKIPNDWRNSMDELFSYAGDFPPSILIGAAPDNADAESFNFSMSPALVKQGQELDNASISSRRSTDSHVPPVVTARLLDTVLHLCKNSPRFSLHCMSSSISEDSSETKSTCFEKFLDLLDIPGYTTILPCKGHGRRCGRLST